jgi:transcriptional regulator with XRE-family HTH domain
MVDPKTAADHEAGFRASMMALRAAQDLSQTALANALREAGYAFHQQTVAKIESGDRPVRLEEAYAIAEALGSSMEQMARGPQRAEAGWALKSAQAAVLAAYNEVKEGTSRLMSDLSWLDIVISDARRSGEYSEEELLWDAYAIQYDPISAVQEGVGLFAADVAVSDVLDKYRVDKYSVEHVFKLYRELLDAERRVTPSDSDDPDEGGEEVP